jgi:hypothetical protein
VHPPHLLSLRRESCGAGRALLRRLLGRVQSYTPSRAPCKTRPARAILRALVLPAGDGGVSPAGGGRPVRRAKRRRASEASLRWLRAFRRSEFHPLRLGEVVAPDWCRAGGTAAQLFACRISSAPLSDVVDLRLVSVASCFARRISSDLSDLLLSFMRRARRVGPFSSESYILPRRLLIIHLKIAQKSYKANYFAKKNDFKFAILRRCGNLKPCRRKGEAQTGDG